jgi:hypothetical protein
VAPPRGARIPGLAGLVVKDLLEDLSHARAHQVAGCRVVIVVAAANALGLAGIQWFERLNRLLAYRGRAILAHAAIVARDERDVNRLSRRASR